MSKTKIDVIFNIANYGVDPKITMRALLRKANANYRKGSISGALIVKPRHEIAKYETFQLIAANYHKLDELDNLANEAKGAIKMIIEAMPAELVHSKRKSDKKDYDAILLNFGTEKAPHIRAFYLSDMQSELLTKGFKPQAEFTLQEENLIEEEELEEEQQA